MAITVNLRYTGQDGAARAFAEEMTASGIVAAIAALREKYDLHMIVERYVSLEENKEDERFIRK